MHKSAFHKIAGLASSILVMLAAVFLAASLCSSASGTIITRIFKRESTPADLINQHSHLVLAITGVIFLVVGSLLTYAVVKCPQTPGASDREPASAN